MAGPGKKKKDRSGFRPWYAGMSARLGLDPDPDNPLHFYDWRAAHRAGAKPDRDGHWPSTFKQLGHPALIVDGVDTRTGKPASTALSQTNEIVRKLATHWRGN